MSGAIAATTAVAAGVGGLAQAYGAKKSADAQKDSAYQQIAFMDEQQQKARDDIAEFYPQALEAQQTGLGRQLQMQQATAMPAAQAMQQGNVGAQQVLSGSMPQYQNAIMGNQVDYGFAQPRQFSLQGLQDVLARGQELDPYSGMDLAGGGTTGTAAQNTPLSDEDRAEVYFSQNPDVLAAYKGLQTSGAGQRFNDLVKNNNMSRAEAARWHYENAGKGEDRRGWSEKDTEQYRGQDIGRAELTNVDDMINNYYEQNPGVLNAFEGRINSQGGQRFYDLAQQNDWNRQQAALQHYNTYGGRREGRSGMGGLQARLSGMRGN